MKNLLEHPNEHSAVAEWAATIYGQDWGKIPGFSRERWMSAVKDAAATVNAGGDSATPVEAAACQAVREWRDGGLPKPASPVVVAPKPEAEAEDEEVEERPVKHKLGRRK